MQAIAHSAERIGFAGIIPIAAFLIALSNVGAAGAFLASVARLPFVAGLDRYLPPVFGALHPRWRTPWFSLLTQFALGVVFAFLGQAGTTVRNAYNVLVAMSVITNFIPYLYLFASMFKIQNQPAGPGVIRVPGGRPIARLVSIVGLLTTSFTIVVSLIPQPDDPHKVMSVIKVVGSTVVLLAVGVWLYWSGKKRAAATPALPSSSGD
jgi:amino acid transporter